MSGNKEFPWTVKLEDIPHGNGGKDAVYVCEKCGEEIIEPYEWSSADSI